MNNLYVYEKIFFFEIFEGEKFKVLIVKNEEYEVEWIIGELIVYKFFNCIEYCDYVVLYCGNY